MKENGLQCSALATSAAAAELPPSRNNHQQQQQLHSRGQGLLSKYGLHVVCRSKDESPRLRSSHVARTASSPSPSLDGYSEQLQDVGVTEKKKRTIAGIDQDELLDPVRLADSDSRFCEFEGVHFHFKICEPEPNEPSVSQEHYNISQIDEKKLGLAIILMHGFGASLFSWNRVMRPLSQLTGSKVLAFDRPAFGLTSRASYSEYAHKSGDKVFLNPYSMKFSELATLHFIDFLASDKAVLVGHSAGSLTAVGAYFDAPERVAALILVAPAILAPRAASKVKEKVQGKIDEQIKEIPNSVAGSQANFFSRIWQTLSAVYKLIAMTIGQMNSRVMNAVDSAYKNAVAAILRSAIAVTLVRLIISKFGVAAVRNAWYDTTQVTDHILNGYTKPLRCKGWDKALVEYTVAMLTDPAADAKPPPSRRLNEIKCPVLIISGDSDRIVPSWNSKRLAKVIPNSQLEILKNCGHLPHEEKAEEFISLVQKFLQNIRLAGSEDYCLQA